MTPTSPAVIALAALVGGGIGVTVALALPSGSTAPTDPGDASAEATGAGPADCTTRLADLESRREALLEERDALALTERLMRSQLAIIGGLPSAWPDEVDPAFTPEAVGAHLDRAAADLEGVEILDLHCAEYPCLATAHRAPVPGAEPGVVSSTPFMPLYDGFAGVASVSSAPVKGGAPGETLGVLILGPSGLDADTNLRLEVRRDRLLEALREGFEPEAPR